MQQARSNFVTPGGLVILAALALYSAYIGAGLLFALLAGLFIICLVSWLWTRFSLRNIELSLEDSEVCAYPGEKLEVGIDVFNDKMLPLVWLRAAFPLDENSCVRFAEEEAAVFSWVMPKQKLSWKDGYDAVRRGVCTVPAADLSSGDGLGLSDISKSYRLSQPLRMVVFPEYRAVDIRFLLSRLSELEPARNGFYTDPTLLKTVRDMVPSDSIRDINWRLLAREGKLQINVREKLDARRICFLIDLESYSVSERKETNTGIQTVYHVDERLEKSLSVIGSCISDLEIKGVICSLAVPGYTVKLGADKLEVQREPFVSMPEGETRTRQLLTALSEIDYQGGPAVLPVDALAEENHLPGQVFVFSLRRSDAAETVESATGLAAFSVIAEGSADLRCITEKELLL